MPTGEHNLAIETSSRAGSVSLGRGDELLETVEMPEQRRHTVDLMPTIDRLCQRQSLAPRDIGELYVSVGPGSFTGLRVGIATAKALAQVLGLRLVAVPTLEVVAQNVPPGAQCAAGCGAVGDARAEGPANLAVCMNLKRDTVYAGMFAPDGRRWVPASEPALMTMAELLARAPRPLTIVGNPLPEWPSSAEGLVCLLPPELAVPRSEAVWALGRALARAGQFTDPILLLPLYVRAPEAEELWNKRHGLAPAGSASAP